MSINANAQFQFYLQSINGTMPNNNPNMVQFNFSNKGIIVSEENQISISVSAATIKLTWYNVNTNNNFFQINGRVYQIPEGNYNSRTLLTALNALNITGYDDLPVTVTYDSTKQHYIFSAENGLYFDTSTTFQTARFLLGLDFNSYDFYGAEVESNVVIDLTYTSMIYIVCRELLNLSRTSMGICCASKILAAIPVTVNSMGVINITNTTRTMLFTKVISLFTIEIRDEMDRLIPFNGGGWDMTLDFQIITDDFIVEQRKLLNELSVFGTSYHN